MPYRPRHQIHNQMHPIPISIPILLPIPPGTNITSSKSRQPPRPPSHMPSQPNSNASDIDSNYEFTHHYNPYSDPDANTSATASRKASPTASATTQPCEFTTPCTTHLDTIPNSPPSSPEPLPTPNPPPRPARKLITHIFGRNKLSTRLFPPSVWVHYCRKHYQRARYRAPNWAVAQVDLVFVSLERMGVWGGVRAFEVVLRKRAMDLWADEGEEGLEEGEGGDQDHDDDDDFDAGEMRRKRKRQTAVASRGQGKVGGRGIPKRKKPTIPKGSVPSWLREHLGPNKSFAEVRTMLEQLRMYLKEQERRRQGSSKATKKTQLRFPDIEILPVFKEWVGAGGRDEVAVES